MAFLPVGFAAFAVAGSIATLIGDAAPRLLNSEEAELTPTFFERLRFRLGKQYAPRAEKPRRLAPVDDTRDFDGSHYAADVIFIWPIYVWHKV
jgi:hypothetical protein